MLLLWVLILGHCSIPLFAFPRILKRCLSQLAKTKREWSGALERGQAEVLTVEAGLGVVVWADLGALRKDVT